MDEYLLVRQPDVQWTSGWTSRASGALTVLSRMRRRKTDSPQGESVTFPFLVLLTPFGWFFCLAKRCGRDRASGSTSDHRSRKTPEGRPRA